MKGWAAVTTIALVGLCGACGADSGVEPHTPPLDLDPDGDGILPTIDHCPFEPENFNNFFDGDGCPDIPSHYYDLIQRDMEMMWAEWFLTAERTYVSIERFRAYTQPISTPCGALSMYDASYCALDTSVYYDDNMVTNLLLLAYGDAGPAFVFGHEIGLHVGLQLGLRPPSIADLQAALLADCFAGVWLARVAGTGFLEIADADRAVARMLGDGIQEWKWFSPAEHGTVEQRRAAVDRGFQHGVSGCTSHEFVSRFSVE